MTKSFRKWWPDLESELSDIEHEIASRTPNRRRDVDEVLEDLFASTKSMQRQMERVVEQLRRERQATTIAYAGTESRPTADAPAEIALGDRDDVLDFAARLEDASELWLLGKSLDTITSNHFDALKSFVSGGGRLRVLVLDRDDADLIEVTCRGLYGFSNAEDLRTAIQEVLDRLDQLGQVTFVLRRGPGHWFEHFKDQFESMWASARRLN